jgi:hypothetical protein
MRCDRWNTPVADREQAVTICVLSCLVLTNGRHQWLSRGDKKQKQKKRRTEIMTSQPPECRNVAAPADRDEKRSASCLCSEFGVWLFNGWLCNTGPLQ